MSDAPLTIAGMGAVTPVGLSAPATCSALRAGIARMNLLEGWSDGGPLPEPPFAAGRVPLEWLQPDFPYAWPGHEKMKLPEPQPHLLVAPGAERLLELAIPAAEEAWGRAGYAGQRGPGVGLYLGLDESDEGTPVAEAIAGALGVRFELVRRDRFGRAAGLAALHRAARHLRDDRVRVAIVGGVDSLLRRGPVARLLEQGRLKHDEMPHGVIPGEAAAFVVLQADAGRGRVSLEYSAVAEEETARTGEPCRGVGLTRVLRETGAKLPEYPHVVCDLNGERYRHMEWGLASVRALGKVGKRPGGPAETDLRHPADCIGDAGAASGLVNVVWAATAIRKGYARSDRALVWGASDGVLRAAVTLALDAN
jgi:3-oxoacyl-[acyl-carrier-protein] synthase-1